MSRYLTHAGKPGSQWFRERIALAVSIACGTLTTLSAPGAHADPFEDCPSAAFLTQGSVPQTYAVDLVTGDYTLAGADHGTSRPLNGVGFNPNDNFLYAWGYEDAEPVRIHADWSIEPLGVAGLPGSNFFVGDISPALNEYFVYQKGRNRGLYSIDLDPESPGYLQMVRVIDGASLFLFIYDFAFSPVTGELYAVDRDGELHRIDPTDGSAIRIGNVGQSGTFGATYFDAEGNLYIGRNSDGKVFRIRPDSGDVTAELFANGPAASTNDGSRCALAPLVSADAAPVVDYGNAPDSYGTRLADNGARHGQQNPGLYFGDGVDGESDGYPHPLSDDVAGSGEADDGVQFVSSLQAGRTALAQVAVSAPGFVNAWIDTDRDGRFDAAEHLVIDAALGAGTSTLALSLPPNLSPGSTWARFRLSSSQGVEATGGVPDGEVEDLQLTLLPGQTTVVNYPSEQDFATVAFEDNWPFAGDYDMNDLVVHLRTAVHSDVNGVTGIGVTGELAAVGASYHNGFAIALPGVARADVDEEQIEFSINGEPVSGRSVLEPGRDQAILIIDTDMLTYVADGEECVFFRTEPGCGSGIEMTFELSVPFVAALDLPLAGVFDPFLFATPGQWHGDHFSSPPGRSYEIHLKNRAPTEAFDLRLFAGIGQDASDPAQGIYFQTGNGLPWALEVGTRWEHPFEFRDVAEAYPRFADFGRSGGSEHSHWYDRTLARDELIFQD